MDQPDPTGKNGIERPSAGLNPIMAKVEPDEVCLFPYRTVIIERNKSFSISFYMHFVIQPGPKTSIFTQQDHQEATRDEVLISRHFSDFPESQLAMLLDRCNQDIPYLHEGDLRYMAARVSRLLRSFLEKSPEMDQPPVIVLPIGLQKLLPEKPETMPVREFITVFAGKDPRS